jgi:DNA ligase (NAD+)
MLDLVRHTLCMAKSFNSSTEYQTAVTQARAAAQAYYDDEGLRMDDGTYDELMHRIEASEAAHPEWGVSGIASEVAGGASRGGDVKHSAAMLSLDNAYDDEELTSWFQRLGRASGAAAAVLCVEPKLDGLALAARYVNGVLQLVVTRGDGTTGEDVTAQASMVAGLPAQLSGQVDFEVRGECVMTNAQFDVANTIRMESGKPAFANPRNAVAGSIRRLGSQTAMTFCAYGVVNHANAETLSHTALMTWLEELGLNTAIAMGRNLGAGAVTTIADAANVCLQIAAHREELDCGIDGAVVKADEPSVRAAAGSTGKAPRWAVARKFPPDTKTTKLLDIECAVGRTGALTVRALLEPVAVGGVVIRYCTLSNPSEIARKDLRINDTVFVRRAGEVIPEITAVLLADRMADSVVWAAPTTCPQCDMPLDKSKRVWRCPQGRSCGLARAIEYACSREALDIEGMGGRLVAQLVERGHINDVADVFSLTEDQLAQCDRMGETSARNVLAQIEIAKQLPFSRVLTALGVRMTGRRRCLQLARHFGSFAKLRAATLDELAAVDGIGEVRASSILNELVEIADVCARLLEANIGAEEPMTQEVVGGPLDGKKVCVTGSITGLTRDGAHALVESLGGKVVSGITKSTDLLVLGDGGGSKAKKAADLGITTISGDDLLAMS